MNQIGNRIYYDQNGDILFQTGEMQGDVLPRKENIHVAYIDLDYGEIDYRKHKIVGVDVLKQQPILEEIPQMKTEEQLQIEQLENELLLASGVI